RRKEQSRYGRSERFGFSFFWRAARADFSPPRKMLPASASNSASFGKQACTDSRFGSPAYTPDRNGATSFSSTSSPNRRRTNESMLSSPFSLRPLIKGSLSNRSFAEFEISFVLTSAGGLIGTACNL